MWVALFLTACEIPDTSSDLPVLWTPDPQTPVPITPAPTGDCSAYLHEGVLYDCGALDRCEPDDLSAQLACCSCDPGLCDPDPACFDEPPVDVPADSCMSCHNGSERNDYLGSGIGNPHPFGVEAFIACTRCHGGDGQGGTAADAHVPPPPELGDGLRWIQDPGAYFEVLTRTGIDRLPDYEIDGVSYSALDWLQFVNPGDLRVVSDGRGCGLAGCHDQAHAAWVPAGPIASDRLFSSAMFGIGADNAVPESVGLWQDTAADHGWRPQLDPGWIYDPEQVGRVGRLLQIPERGVYGDPDGIWQDPLYDATIFATQQLGAEDRDRAGAVRTGGPLHQVIQQAISGACADCHAYSAGANNRYGDFRSSGCTACHMEYSFDGTSRSSDPFVYGRGPADPDAIAAPERPHVADHQIRNVTRPVVGGGLVRGQSDRVCVACHQGSNRTVLQYWGIRLDPGRDVVSGTQYPANPVSFTTAERDPRLFDPGVGNVTFGGRTADQYLLTEDYDGDGRDDTPPDVHHEAGLGCIDCHGSRDLHNGTEGDPTSGRIYSHQDQVVGIACVSCHGTVEARPATTGCTTYDGVAASCATDRFGNPLRNVVLQPDGALHLIGRVDGARHYVPQSRDVVIDAGAVDLSGALVYSPAASYAMGRADGSSTTGIGPLQADGTLYASGFTHLDDVSCEACHAAWTNSCVGCHLTGIYDDSPDSYLFSNVTGQRVVQTHTSQLAYASPVFASLGVSSHDQIASGQPGMSLFFRYVDLNEVPSEVFALSDRLGQGNNPDVAGRGPLGALSHDRIAPHSVRGRVTAESEGARMCVSCHLNVGQLARHGDAYQAFADAVEARDYAALDYELLAEHIGRNPGNQLDSPYQVHMVAGLGTGLLQLDAAGCPNNPLDASADRAGCVAAPAADFDPVDTAYDLDKIVEASGASNASGGHPLLSGSPYTPLRAGALQPGLAGPLGVRLLERLADPDAGLILDAWFDADGTPQGAAPTFLP